MIVADCIDVLHIVQSLSSGDDLDFRRFATGSFLISTDSGTRDICSTPSMRELIAFAPAVCGT